MSAGSAVPSDGPLPSLAERAAAAAQVFVSDPTCPVLEEADAHHLGRVLRLRPGELVVAADGAGRWCMCRWRGDASGRAAGRHLDLAALLEPAGPVHEEPAPGPPVTVAFAPVKGERPEWVVQKLTEVGVDEIVPLVTERAVVRWVGPRAAQNVTRLRRVAREAAAQSRRLHLPAVRDVTTLAGCRTPGESGPWLADLGGGPLPTGVSMLAVGPEGGWSAREREEAPGLVGLGPTVLRAETAALVAGVLLAGRRVGGAGGPGGSAGGAGVVTESARCRRPPLAQSDAGPRRARQPTVPPGPPIDDAGARTGKFGRVSVPKEEDVDRFSERCRTHADAVRTAQAGPDQVVDRRG